MQLGLVEYITLKCFEAIAYTLLYLRFLSFLNLCWT